MDRTQTAYKQVEKGPHGGKDTATTTFSFKQTPDTNELTLSDNIHDLLNCCKNIVVVLLKESECLV